MMVYTKNLILVCTGRDTTKAASLGHAGFAALPWHFAVRGAAAAQGVRGAATLACSA